MSATDVEKAAKKGVEDSSVDSMVTCIQENSDQSDPRAICIGGDIKKLVAENSGSAEEDVKEEDALILVNAGSSSRSVEGTRACRVAAGEDETKKKECLSKKTVSNAVRDTTGKDNPSATDVAMSNRQMKMRAYCEAATSTADAEVSDEKSDANMEEQYKRDIGGDFNNPELAMDKIDMQKTCAAMQVEAAATACVNANANQDACAETIVNDYIDGSGRTSTTSGHGRRRLVTQAEKIGMKRVGANALIESRMQACLDTGKEKEDLKTCVYDSTTMKSQYELLRVDNTKANDIRQVVSSMSTQREVDCRNAKSSSKTECKMEGKRLWEQLKFSAPSDHEGVRPQETYAGAQARRMFGKFQNQMECDATKKKACEDSVVSEGEKLGYEKSQLKILTIKALKSRAAQIWADNKETGAQDEDSTEAAKTFYLKYSTAEDFASMKDKIIKLGRDLYDGKPTEVRTSDNEIDTLITAPGGDSCDAAFIEKNRMSIKRAASNAKTIVISYGDVAGTCQILYKTKVSNGAAATTAHEISQSMSRRRLRSEALSERRRLANSDVSSSPSQEEVPYGEKSTQEYVEPTTTSESDDGTMNSDDDDATLNDVDSDDDFSDGRLSSATSMHHLHIQVIFTVLTGIAAVLLC